MRMLNAILGLYLLCHIEGVGLTQIETTADTLQHELVRRHSDVMKQARIERQEDPELYNKRLETIDEYLQKARWNRGGIAGGISVAIGGGIASRRGISQDVLHKREAVPFLLDVVINGPPPQTKGLWKPVDAKKNYSYPWKSGEYELWARCLAIGIVGRYKHPDVIPILSEYLKKEPQTELRIHAAYGLGLSMDPNALEPLIEAMSDSNAAAEVRATAWGQVNVMTGRGFKSGEIPRPDQITDFKNWWQMNRYETINKFYNPKTGRLKPTFEVKRKSQPKRPIVQEKTGEKTLFLAVIVQGDSVGIPPDYDGEWFVQYSDPHGMITELRKKQAVVQPRFELVVRPLKERGGEVLVSFEIDQHFVPWAYVKNAVNPLIKLDQEADLIISKDKAVSLTLQSMQFDILSQYQSIGFYFSEDSKLPIYSIDLKNISGDVESSWSTTLNVMPRTYYLRGRLSNSDQYRVLGQIEVQEQADDGQSIEIPLPSEASESR